MNKTLSDSSILMISLDKGLLSGVSSGDVVSRHVRHARGLKRLDIIVMSGQPMPVKALSDNCFVYGVGKSVFNASALGQKLIKKFDHDLIDTQDPHWTGLVGYWLKKKFNKKLEIHFHGDFWANPLWLQESMKNRVLALIQKKVVRHADAIRVVNQKIKDKLVNAGLSATKIAVINTAVNETAFTGLDETQASKLKKQYNKKILLFVGRLVAAKNLYFMIDVLVQMKAQRDDFVMLVIGEGEQRTDLEKKVKDSQLADTIIFLGAKEQQDLLAYYQAAYILVLLSTNESFGKVIIEAGLAKTGTLASRALGPVDIINDGRSGWLVDINDATATVTKLNELLDKETMVAQVGQIAQAEFLEKYSQEASYQKVKEFWFDIINEKQ